MKVGIDLTCITTRFDGGKDQVIYNLLRGFNELGHGPELIIFSYDFLADTVRRLLPGATREVFTRVRGKKLLQDLPLRTFLLPRAVKRLGVDVLLFPKCYTGVRRLPIPTVVVPHDIQFKAFPERLSLQMKVRENILYGFDFRLRDRIVAVSDFDARQIQHFYPREASKVLRIYNPIQFATYEPGAERPHPRPYLLSINIAYPHKNIPTLLQAFDKIRTQVPHDLVLVGKIEPWNRDLVDAVEKQGLSDRVTFAGYVDDARLQRLIHHADVYVNPSLYEGFGMTPIEAMGAGVTVVSSRAAALPETTRELAQYYEPADDPSALADKLLNVLNSPPPLAERTRIQQAVREAYDYRVIAGEYWAELSRLARGC